MIQKTKAAYFLYIFACVGLFILIYLGKLDIEFNFVGSSIHLISKN